MYTYLLSGVDLLTTRCSWYRLIMQHTLLLMAVSSWLLVNVEAAQGELLDYCWPDVFNATCEDNEVILMQSARYGRMNKPQSHCEMSATSSGCYVEVITQLDARCSGRQKCVIILPDKELHDMQPCPKDMLTILEASYTCVAVTYPLRYPCYPLGSPQVLSAQEPGYLLGTVAMPTQSDPPGGAIGSVMEPTRCLWRIQVDRGQRVNLTLYDFSVGKALLEERNMCLMYATIQDSAGGADMTVCRGSQRVRNLIESEGMTVDLEIVTYRTNNPDGVFLIRYEAIGCPDPVVAKGATYKRQLNEVAVTCNHSSSTWYLYCNGTSWAGPRQNCTKGSSMQLSKTTNEHGDDATFPFGLATAVIIGIILGILIGLALLAVILVLNRRKQHRQRYIADGSTQPQPFGGSGTSDTFGTTRLPPEGMTKSYKLDQYGYAHVWELHHLHECPEDSTVSSNVPPSNASGTLTSSIGGGTLKPLKYNVGGDSIAEPPGGYVYSGHMDAGLKLANCPHQTALCGHHMGEHIYPEEGEPRGECHHLDLGNSGQELGGGQCVDHMIAT